MSEPIDPKANTSVLEGRDFTEFQADVLSLRSISAQLDRLNLSADAKALLHDIAEITFVVGSTIVAVGRKLLSTVFDLISEFRGVSFGIVVGATLSFLIGTIPIFGIIFGPMLSPLLMAFGIGMGAVQDFAAMKMKSKLEYLKAEYEVLRP